MPACAFNTVHVRAVAGRSAELGERLQQIGDAVRTAPGCLDYRVHRDPIDRDLWIVTGHWACAEQLSAHFALPALQGFIELTREHLARRLDFDH
ncbi:Antibiotic biosynthesis monooxygenase [Pseudomonas sp. 22 E 5]|jgi:quinol monooxygenase YgiN|uniref:Antibiotic biosynthesis monooxygenase n=1 Tax=Pseudomonas canadensis TaxID=915099 RepID=A0ABZ1A1Q1_9PSED|nr:antibiotic biosynthesis monooxygenase [Pseudomonas canadensis]WLH27584.1 antibiotic biosynthesis monooxygenase [Pseudomonas canadensis]WNJ82941.1 antibiotic biosynthesis monooxygenase [Pseudomonas canadensis]WRI22279.1 antibiotic biosynthesis monooxygenase [Pseudomonas canadensis]CRM89026.1 Antibiotic biosynthesis monooxygenase [Pseudomonas sp. 22 E 5]